MNRIKSLAVVIAIGAGVAAAPAVAAADADVTTPPAAPTAQSKLDPAIQALLIGLAASVLRSMASSSADGTMDPGPALEKTMRSLLSNPDSACMAEGLLAQTLKDAPAELREPLSQVLKNLLRNFRQEMLRETAPRG